MGVAGLVLGAFLALLTIIGGSCWAYPQYGLYQSELEGRARLAEATSSRQIAVLEAKAKMDSAKDLAAAEIERARGVAQANKIIGDSLHGNEAYLRYLWISGLDDVAREVIYIPTEANLPLLEARTPQQKAP
jgi:regulator of protease activity HflC (stomatin/prohibitin superfamily)